MFADAPIRIAEATRNLAVLGQVRKLSRLAAPYLDRSLTRVSVDAPLLEAALARIDPVLSLRAVRARVVSVHDETHDTKTFWLRPNARFAGFRPGSYVTLQLRIAGQQIARSYSMSCAPRADGLFSITVKRVPGGRVSNWLADHVRPGHVLELSPAAGQFVLPERIPERVLMLSAGSGITPVMSMLQQLMAARSSCQVTFLHFARSPRDIIFYAELEQLARSHPNLRVVHCVESAGDAAWSGKVGRFSPELLQELAPDFRQIDTFLCGPAGFMQLVMSTLESSEADLSKLRYERFSVELDASQFLSHSSVIRFVRSGSQSISSRARTILEEAESAGVSVESGCRAGNCGTCRCRKRSGVVVDVTTGLESGPGEQFIYPCVSVARGMVEVDL
jgi:ferredoxin-NADP reductase